MTCGAGVIDVLEPAAGGYARLAQVPTIRRPDLAVRPRTRPAICCGPSRRERAGSGLSIPSDAMNALPDQLRPRLV